MKKNIIKYICLTLAFVFCFLFTSTVNVVYAVETSDAVEYSDVLYDLELDSGFKKDDYPLDETRIDMEVISLAESEDYELFVYVYQPSGTSKNLVASSINISLEHKNVKFKNYTLTLINQNGVFQKYKVDDFTVDGSKTTRYYEITGIYRVYDSTIDAGLSDDNDNTINEVVFKVGKSYRLTDNFDGTYDVYVEDLEVVTVTSKYLGFCRYPDGGIFTYIDACDVHFVAFSTDWRTDYLLEIDISYVQQDVYYNTKVNPTKEFGAKEKKTAYISSEKDLTYNGNGWFSASYEWQTIQKPDEFLAGEKEGQVYQAGIFDVTTKSLIDDTAKANILSQDWVVRFAVTDYAFTDHYNLTVPYSEYDYTTVGEVSILRLAFKTENKVYNLGVVDNKQTGSDDPVNETETVISFTDDFLNMVKILLGLIALCILCMFISPILSIVIPIVKFIINAIIWVISLPFKLIATLFKK